jgi:uncharacterized membrane protein
MSWLQRYSIRHYVQNSVWVIPLLGAVAAMVLVRPLYLIDLATGWGWRLDPEVARMVMVTMASAMFTFIIFVSSALLIAVQLASAQLTPRIIGFLFRDRVIKVSLTVFVFTFTFSMLVMIRIKTSVPLLTTLVGAYGCLASLMVFLYLIDHLGKALSPSGTLTLIGREASKVIAGVYPRRLISTEDTEKAPADVLNAELSRTIASLKGGVVLAMDPAGLESIAQRGDCVIEVVPRVGDFVGAGDPLFRIYGGGGGGGGALSGDELYHSIALGQERTLEQDPTFAFRIIVDVANKGLSPAINDPTTAVLAIDQIHHLLRDVGSRHLDEGVVRDASGGVRLVYRTPDWEDYVHLAVTEIRQFGESSIQIARRLRAMLEDLIKTLPKQRAALLVRELGILQRTAIHAFPVPEDRALAEVSDLQGVGSGQRRKSGTG